MSVLEQRHGMTMRTPSEAPYFLKKQNDGIFPGQRLEVALLLPATNSKRGESEFISRRTRVSHMMVLRTSEFVHYSCRALILLVSLGENALVRSISMMEDI